MVIMLLMIIFGSFQTFVSTTVLILQDDSPDDEALLGRAAKLLGVLLRI